MLNDKDTEIKTKYDDLSVDELKEALKNTFFYAGEFSDADMEEMDQIMAALDRKEPLDPLYTAEESLKQFQEAYGEELSSLGVRNTEEVMQETPAADTDAVCSVSEVKTVRPMRRRRLLRVALVAAATIVILFAIAATASAMGYNILGWVPKWNESTIQYVPDVPEDSTAVTSLDIPTALKQLGVEEPLFPTWLPEGFILAEQQFRLDSPVVLYASYFFKDRTISIYIRSSEDGLSLAMEKNLGEPIEYVVHGISHFIYSNTYQTDSYWYSQWYCAKVYGDISLDEMKSIIETIKKHV